MKVVVIVITEQVLLSLIIYMIINVVTDFLHLKTYNKWHFIFLIYIVFYSIYWGEGVSLIVWGILISLFIGGVQSRLSKNEFGAGDIKMLVITSLFLILLNPTESLLKVIVVHCIVYMLLSFFIVNAIILIHRIRSKKDFKLGGYSYINKQITTPEALPIFVSVLITNYIY